MKKILYALIAFIMIHSECKTVFGPTNYNNFTIQELVTILGFCTFNNLSAANGLIVNGGCKGEKLQTTTFTINGLAQLQEVTANVGKVNGAAILNKMALRALHVKGKCELYKSTITDLLKVKGQLTVEDSIIGTITAQTPSISLKNTTVLKDITVSANPMFSQITISNGVIVSEEKESLPTPTIELTGNTHVKGDITFTKEAGIVYCGAKAKISGKVINGRIVT